MEMGNGQFTMPPQTSSNGSDPSTNRRQAAYATERANILFGGYRRGDANDPDTYVASIAAVLALYEFDLIREVTDPRTGISQTEKFKSFMPNSGELKAYCDAQRDRILRNREYAKLPRRTTFGRLPAPPKVPGYLANMLIHKDAPGYDEIVRNAEKADVYQWKWDEQGRGIWVTLTMWENRHVKAK